MQELQTRAEHSRSLADAEVYQAINDLTTIGLLTPLATLDTYHGRVGQAGEPQWQVDPSINNGGDNTGNSNVNKRATLYTSDQGTARDFAIARQREKSYGKADSLLQAETHKIVSEDPDARIINFSFDYDTLSEDDQALFHEALASLILHPTDGSPVDFADKDHAPAVFDALLAESKHPQGIITHGDIAAIVGRLGASEQLVKQLAGAYNAGVIAFQSPVFLTGLLASNSDDIVGSKVKQKEFDDFLEIPINLEYVQRFFRAAHIVGVRQDINSATINRQVSAVSFFDLEKINTEPALLRRKQAIARTVGSLARLEVSPEGTTRNRLLRTLTENPYVKPEEIIALASTTPGYESVFDQDAGNWEGYTLGEHTETVLRNFDENFADQLPVELLASMRLALLVHDLGKPAARHAGEGHKQKQYNERFAADFMKKLGVPEPTANLLRSLIGDGLDFAYRGYIKNEDVTTDFEAYARKQLQALWGAETPIDQKSIDGYRMLCKMILICDGGAYTSMAVNRVATGVYFRNAPAFNQSFARSQDLGYRRTRLASSDDERAPKRHVVDSGRPQSRVKVSGARNRNHRPPTV